MAVVLAVRVKDAAMDADEAIELGIANATLRASASSVVLAVLL